MRNDQSGTGGMEGMKKERFGLGFSDSVNQVNWFFVSILIVAILFLTGIYAASQMTDQYYNDDIEVFYQTSNLKKALSQCDNSMQEYLRTDNRASLVQYNEGTEYFQKSRKALDQYVSVSEEISLLRSISDAFYSYENSSNFAAFSYYEKEMGRCYESLNEAQKISGYLQQYCDELLETHISVSHLRLQELHQVRRKTLLVDGATVLILAVISLLGIHTLTESFDKPLVRLYRASLEVSSGNYNARIPEEYKESTMKLLAQTFNCMTQNILNMVKKLEESKQMETRLLNEQLKNEQYEHLLEQANLLALQSQMNPHFMFNTLNSISRTITLSRGEDAVMMIDALTGLLRYNLQNANVPATLADELWVVSQYLTIQEYRFQDRIHTYFDCDETMAARVHLPRFTLQPIVENAVIHGLEPKMQPGNLWITVTYPDNRCLIEIRDDGVGILPETLENLMTGGGRERAGHTTSIGIHNTRKRLEIFTHSSDSFRMENHPEGGTLVQIYLPLDKGAKEEEHV